LFPRIGQEDEDLFVPKALQFLEGLEDAIPADFQFPEERVGGVNGQGSVVVCQWAQRLRRQVGSGSAGRLEASQQRIGRLGTIEVDTAVAHGHEGIGQLTLEILGSAPEGPEQPARSGLARVRIGRADGEV
jgi:hypothetical protein